VRPGGPHPGAAGLPPPGGVPVSGRRSPARPRWWARARQRQRVLRGVLLAASTEGCVGVEPGRCLPAARPPEQACLIIRQRGAPNDACEKTFAAQFIDLLYLYVIALAASSYGYYRGQIKPRAAQEFAVHVADQRERTKCLPHRHPPRVQPVAPRREHTADVHDCPRGVAPSRHPLALKDTPVATHGRRNDAIAAPASGGAPAHCSSFRRLAMASLHWRLVGSSCYNSTRAE
jgi:hypothetical protein